MTGAAHKVVVASTWLPVPRELYVEALADVATLAFLPDLDGEARAAALREADAIIVLAAGAELTPDEIEAMAPLRFVQAITTGVDHLPPGLFPRHIPMGNTAGAAAAAIAEHVLAMALAAAKRLTVEHNRLAAGIFGYGRLNRMLAGGTACILGFGEIGRETARRFRALGLRVEALNRTGSTDAEVDFIGTLDDLDGALERCDVLVVSAALNETTRGLIARPRLRRMKPDATLVVVSRAAIVDQKDLYDHLVANPGFTACIDTWWAEDIGRDTPFAQDFPFLDLPNVIGSPHNSGIVPGVHEEMVRRAALNVRRFLTGEGVVRLVPEADRP